MQQYMIKTSQINNNNIILDKDDLFHIFKVMRMSNNDCIICADYLTNKKYLCNINNNDIIINKEIDDNRELAYDLVLACSMTKSDKLELIMQKAVELGVSLFIPLITDYSIVKIDDAKIDKKMIRWQKIIKEASEQCYRNTLMNIIKPINIKDINQYSNNISNKIVAYEKEELSNTIYKVLSKDSAIIVIGAEGGLSNNDLKILDDNNFKRISLGKRILRMETASIVSIALITNYLESDNS